MNLLIIWNEKFVWFFVFGGGGGGVDGWGLGIRVFKAYLR